MPSLFFSLKYSSLFSKKKMNRAVVLWKGMIKLQQFMSRTIHSPNPTNFFLLFSSSREGKIHVLYK